VVITEFVGSCCQVPPGVNPPQVPSPKSAAANCAGKLPYIENPHNNSPHILSPLPLTTVQKGCTSKVNCDSERHGGGVAW